MNQRAHIGVLACVGLTIFANAAVAEQPGPLGGIPALPGFYMKSMPVKGTWISHTKWPTDGSELITTETRIVLSAEGRNLQGHNYLDLGDKFTGEFIPGTPPIVMLRHQKKMHVQDGWKEFTSISQAASLEDSEPKAEFLAGKREKLELLDLIVKAEKSATQANVALLKARIDRRPEKDQARDVLKIQLHNAENRLRILERATE